MPTAGLAWFRGDNERGTAHKSVAGRDFAPGESSAEFVPFAQKMRTSGSRKKHPIRSSLPPREPSLRGLFLIVGESVACGNSIIDSAPDAGLQRMQFEKSSRFPVLCRYCTVLCLRRSRHEILRREVDFDGRFLDNRSWSGLDRRAGLLRSVRLGQRLRLSLLLLWILRFELGRLRAIRLRNELLFTGRMGRLFDLRPGLLAVRPGLLHLCSVRWNRLRSVRRRKLRGGRIFVARSDSKRSMAEEEHVCGTSCSR